MPSENRPLSKFAAKLKRRATVAIVLMVVAIPFAIHGARQSVEQMRITPEKWISTSHPQRQEFEQFRMDFEGNDVVFVSWEDCTLSDPRLTELQYELRSNNLLPDNPDVTPFEQVLTGTESLAEMTSGSLRLEEEEAIDRLGGFLVGADGTTSGAVIVLSYNGNEYRDQSIEQILNVAENATDLSRDEIIIAGPPHDGVVIDAESVRGVNLYGAFSTLVAAIVCLWCLKSWKISGLIIGIAALGQGIVLSIIYYSGMTLDAILIVTPALIFVLTVSAGIHFVNYFTAQADSLDNEQALRAALEEGWKPCWLAVVTTAIGLSSLALSRIQPVAAFGAVSATGLIASVGLLMFLLPDAIRKWPLNRRSSPGKSTKQLSRLSVFVRRFPSPITFVFGLLTFAALMGTTGLTTSVDVTGLFSQQTKIIRDYQWIESNIGATVPVEVVVHFENEDDAPLLDQIQFVKEIHLVVAGVDGIQAVMSASTFLPDKVFTEPSGSLVRQAVLRRRLHDSREELDRLNYFAENDQQQSWRITGRVCATAGTSYGSILKEIQTRVTSRLDENQIAVRPSRISYTGMMPLIETVQMMILGDLFWSLLTAFTLIGVVIFVVLRRPLLSGIVTVLNTFPVVIVFGSMGLLGVPVDIGTMMTAGVALGIAVDDTVHFLCYYQRQLAETGDRRAAVCQSMVTCGSAMLQTTLICVASMLVFALSAFVPTRQFGLIMSSILLTAVLCDLIWLPAILLANQNRKGTEHAEQVVNKEMPMELAEAT